MTRTAAVAAARSPPRRWIDIGVTNAAIIGSVSQPTDDLSGDVPQRRPTERFSRARRTDPQPSSDAESARTRTRILYGTASALVVAAVVAIGLAALFDIGFWAALGIAALVALGLALLLAVLVG